MDAFVGRKTELSQLHDYLQRAYKGQGKVCFISGEAGSGKSRLIYEFSNEAQKNYKNLLFLVGTCNDKIGMSDSYLPFRKIIYQLLGENEGTDHLVSKDNTNRLRSILKTSTRALIETAPELIGSLIPGAGILVSIGKFAADELGWLDRLKKVAEDVKENDNQLEKAQIMYQYTALIREVASQTPIVIVLDDLQWADEASINLLFHLIRELENSPVLFIGLYRPNDIQLLRNGERHPLLGVLNEVMRYHGDVSISLDSIQHGRKLEFINAFIDSEPNKLDVSFRQNLFDLTQGHPLFTIEIVRNMQEKGELIKDDQGQWISSEKLDWADIPLQVEAVIKERINRLNEEFQSWLSTASVEGQIFTAQVIADLHKSELRYLLKQLSQELEKKHRLVRESHEVQLSNDFLFQYAFSHSLFLQYIYSSISNPEKRILHGEVAESLEQLYGDHISLIDGQLAYHYTKAGNTKEAIKHLTQAAEFSISVSDMKQARLHIKQALLLSTDLESFQAGWLHYLMGRCEDALGHPELAEDELTVSIKLLSNSEKKNFLIYPTGLLGNILRKQGRYDEAMQYLEKAYDTATMMDDKVQITKAMRRISLVYRRIGKTEEAFRMLEQSLEISKSIDDKTGMMYSYNSLGVQANIQGKFDVAQTYYETAIAIAEKQPSKITYSMMLGNLGSVLRRKGNYQESLKWSKKALEIALKVGVERSIAYRRMGLGYIYYYLQDFESLMNEVELGKPIAKKIKDNQLHTNFLLLEGYIALEKGNSEKAIKCLSTAVDLKYRNYMPHVLATYAIALARYGDNAAAQNIALLTIEKCNEIIKELPESYKSHFSKGLAFATLAIINDNDQDRYMKQSVSSYKQAIKLCNEAGAIDYEYLRLNELSPLDNNGVLTPIQKLLSEVKKQTDQSEE